MDTIILNTLLIFRKIFRDKKKMEVSSSNANHLERVKI